MKKAVLLINIGSPDKLKISATRRYLRKFLMDKRVIDIPFLLRYFLVNGIIAPFRAPKSLKAYQQILIHQQSPLIYYSYQLQKKLQSSLGNDYIVKVAMMYGEPYLRNILSDLKKEHLSEIIIIPLYPQYASSTTGSALEQVFDEIKNWQVIPNIRTLHTFYHHQDFIDLWAHHIQKYLPKEFDFILFSYHGLPIRQIYKADAQYNEKCCNVDNCCHIQSSKNVFCYRFNCLNTTRLIAEKLNIDENQMATSFQSRLGQSEWLKPYTAEYIEQLAKQGVKNLVVLSPAFVTDCLETLFEIEIECKETFLKNGGRELKLIPSLNAEDNWVMFLKKMITE